jgi:hypothetical protein
MLQNRIKKAFVGWKSLDKFRLKFDVVLRMGNVEYRVLMSKFNSE